mgnify:CR=1 FL=1
MCCLKVRPHVLKVRPHVLKARPRVPNEPPARHEARGRHIFLKMPLKMQKRRLKFAKKGKNQQKYPFKPLTSA